MSCLSLSLNVEPEVDIDASVLTAAMQSVKRMRYCERL